MHCVFMCSDIGDKIRRSNQQCTALLQQPLQWQRSASLTSAIVLLLLPSRPSCDVSATHQHAGATVRTFRSHRHQWRIQFRILCGNAHALLRPPKTQQQHLCELLIEVGQWMQQHRAHQQFLRNIPAEVNSSDRQSAGVQQHN
jgi:hypothetical protein